MKLLFVNGSRGEWGYIKPIIDKLEKNALKKEKERKQVFVRVVQCIKDADRETLLAIVEAHIRNQLMEFYKNEELLATLNVMGEPQ